MSNHLGNVLEVLTDRKLALDNGVYNPETGVYSSAIPDGITDYFTPDVVSQSDYFPFGSLFANTNFDPSDGSLIEEENDYRYLFNGKEHDPEVYGNGNIYDYGFRIYNPRLGKFLSQDPLSASYPWYTPYQFAGNTPIMAIDLDGLEEFIMIDQGNGTYRAIWNIKAREKGQAGTIQYVDNAGNIIDDTRKINDFESQNSFLDSRRKIPNAEGENVTKDYIHRSGGSELSNHLPHTTKKNDDGSNSGEALIPANSLIPPPPPPVVTVSPNSGGTTTGSSSSGGGNSSGNRTPPPVPPLNPPPPPAPPPPLKLNIKFNSWGSTIQNPTEVQVQAQPLVNYLLANPTARIVIVTNAGDTRVTQNWASTRDGTSSTMSLGQLADARNIQIRAALISQGVDPSQIVTTRGNPNAGASSNAAVIP